MISKREVFEKNKVLFDRILYMLCPCEDGKKLGEALMLRYLDYIGDLPSPADPEAGGLFGQGLDTALRALGEFEAGYVGERRPDGTLDNFASYRNQPKWRYAVFTAAIGQSLCMVLRAAVKSETAIWNPLEESFCEFSKRNPAYEVQWREPSDPKNHAWNVVELINKIVTKTDVDYMWGHRFQRVILTLTHEQVSNENHVGRFLKPAHSQGAAPPAPPVDMTEHFFRALKALIQNKTLASNSPSAQVYTKDDKTAVVVPISVDRAREFLRGEGLALPDNITLYNRLRDQGLTSASRNGWTVRTVSVSVGQWKANRLRAIIVPSHKLFDGAVERSDVDFSVVDEMGDPVPEKGAEIKASDAGNAKAEASEADAEPEYDVFIMGSPIYPESNDGEE